VRFLNGHSVISSKTSERLIDLPAVVAAASDTGGHGKQLELVQEDMPVSDHSLLSSYREMVLEHLFAGEVMRHVWLSGIKRLEVLKPQVDDGGYDLVLEANAVVRHVQLKASFRGSTVKRFTVNAALATKPSGCVVVLQFDPRTLDIGPFLWFGGPPKQPLPDLTTYPVAKHTKGNAQGVKLPRPNMRVLPLSALETVDTIADLAKRLFGELPGCDLE
jgi:hypothetical protein